MLSYNNVCSQFTNIRPRDGTEVVIPKLIRDHAHAVLASATCWLKILPVCIVYACPIRPYPVPLNTRVHHHQYEYRGRILGRNPDKVVQSFPSSNSQSPLQLCIEISNSSISHNLSQFLEFSHCTLWRRKEKNLIENHTPIRWVFWA
jgi:hypothetical protein